MMLTTILLSAALASPVQPSPVSIGVTEVTYSAPAARVAGEAYVVEQTFTSDGPVELWRFTPAAFEVGGKPLGKRDDKTVDMPKGSKVKVSFDLGANLPEGSFELGCAGSDAKTSVSTLKAVARGAVNFLDLSPEELAKYKVLFVTNRGSFTMEMWPQHAPNHVRNFLDLSNSGFYEGILFHRVSPTFMIQGGDPNTKDQPKEMWGQGGGPRKLAAEFSAEVHHVPGVLSMARSQSPDSASSQFFVMTANATHLDGQYSAFGKVVDGMPTIMKIANAKGEPYAGATMPAEPQRIEHTYVLLPE